MINMDHFCEPFESNFSQDSYQLIGYQLRLTRNRPLFDGYELPVTFTGTVINGRSQPNSSLVCWNFRYNALTLLKFYFQKLNYFFAEGILLKKFIIIVFFILKFRSQVKLITSIL